jgi:predicted lipoprotein with Yx(FWY)xxD motif
MAIAGIAGFALAAVTGLALASTGSKTVKTAHNKKLGKTIVVDSKGLTLYHLAPETTHHLLCKNQACFSFWPPYKVAKNAKLTKGTGIKGKLGKFHRHGFWQVTRGGKPLYHYSGDPPHRRIRIRIRTDALRRGTRVPAPLSPRARGPSRFLRAGLPHRYTW